MCSPPPIAHTATRSRAAPRPTAVMAELYGKIEGCSHGYGGSMHLYDLERGNQGANAVVGGGLPAAVGAGLAFQLRDEPRVSVSFFGDGATNTGSFHEALNLASLWKVKTLFVCENNEWAESTPGWQHSPVFNDMSKRAAAYAMRAIKVDGQDVEKVYEAAHEALEYGARRRGPGLPRHRDLPDARPLHRRPAGRTGTKENATRLPSVDPIIRLRERLGVSEEEWQELDAEVHGDRRGAVEFARNGTDPQPEDALKNVYAELRRPPAAHLSVRRRCLSSPTARRYATRSRPRCAATRTSS